MLNRSKTISLIFILILLQTKCVGASCGRCNGNGNCVIDPVTGETTCECIDGWSGEFCLVCLLMFRHVTNNCPGCRRRRWTYSVPHFGALVLVADVSMLLVLLSQMPLCQGREGVVCSEIHDYVKYYVTLAFIQVRPTIVHVP